MRLLSILVLLVSAFVVGFFVFITADKKDSDRQLQNRAISDEVVTKKCSNQVKNPKLSESKNPQLLKLNEYQELCDSFVSDTMMIFMPFPFDEESSERRAAKTAEAIAEFHARGITPVIVVEPADERGLLSLSAIASAEYQNSLALFFEKLSQKGDFAGKEVLWIPYPEINTPSWNDDGFSPSDFALMINAFNKTLQEHFPLHRMGLLLNSKSYDASSDDWNGGQFVSFRPYLEGMEKGVVDFFVLQGFPWAPALGIETEPSFEASKFLRSDLAIEAGGLLGVKEVWVNSGTFQRKYVSDQKREIEISTQERERILRSVLVETKKIRRQFETVRIHLFAENKENTVENTDWSYEQNQENKEVLRDFVKEAFREKLEISVYNL